MQATASDWRSEVTLKAYASIADGQAHLTETIF
jgi:hypothetical protein